MEKSVQDVEVLLKRELAQRYRYARLRKRLSRLFALIRSLLIWAASIWYMSWFDGIDTVWRVTGVLICVLILHQLASSLNNHLPDISVYMARWFPFLQRVDEHSAAFIASASDKQAIGPLIDMLALHDTQYYYDQETNYAVAAALMRLLPLIEESDVRILTPKQRLELSLNLSAPDPEFVRSGRWIRTPVP